jgi:hypothetical protein
VLVPLAGVALAPSCAWSSDQTHSAVQTPLAGAGQASQDGGGELLRGPWGAGLEKGGLENRGDRFQRTTSSL